MQSWRSHLRSVQMVTSYILLFDYLMVKKPRQIFAVVCTGRKYVFVGSKVLFYKLCCRFCMNMLLVVVTSLLKSPLSLFKWSLLERDSTKQDYVHSDAGLISAEVLVDELHGDTPDPLKYLGDSKEVYTMYIHAYIHITPAHWVLSWEILLPGNSSLIKS